MDNSYKPSTVVIRDLGNGLYSVGVVGYARVLGSDAFTPAAMELPVRSSDVG